MKFLTLVSILLCSFSAHADGIGVPGWEAAAKAATARAESRMRAHNEKLKAAWGLSAFGGFAADAMMDPRVSTDEDVALLYNASTDASLVPGCAPFKGAMLFPGDGVTVPPNAIVLCADGRVIHSYAYGRSPELMRPNAFNLSASAFFGQR